MVVLTEVWVVVEFQTTAATGVEIVSLCLKRRDKTYADQALPSQNELENEKLDDIDLGNEH